MYLSPPVMHAHGIILRFDPNWCSIDAWGDRKGCTRMAGREVHVDITRMRTYDEAGHRRVMHQVHSPSLEHEEVNLIEFPDAHLWYLVHHRKEAEAFVVPLFPAELMIPVAGGIIAARYGVAIRAVMEHGDVEAMRAEAERIGKALAELDAPHREVARIDPAKVSEVREAHAALQAALAKLGG